MELRTHPKANIDFFESYFYYETTSAGLGERFYKEVKEAYAHIKIFPVRHRIIKSNYRIYNLKIFPFQIIYSFNNTTKVISVCAIHHNSKNPKKRFRKF